MKLLYYKHHLILYFQHYGSVSIFKRNSISEYYGSLEQHPIKEFREKVWKRLTQLEVVGSEFYEFGIFSYNQLKELQCFPDKKLNDLFKISLASEVKYYPIVLIDKYGKEIVTLC